MTHMQIDELRIEKLWGEFSVRVRFHPDVNILHGINGSGKTTVLNMVNAILNVELSTLAAIPFSEATLVLRSDVHQRTIVVERAQVVPGQEPSVIYRVGRGARTRVMGEDSWAHRHYELWRAHARKRKGRALPDAIDRESMAKRIAGIVRVRWLSVHRYELRPVKGSLRPITKLVEAKLGDLINQFRDYQLTLEARESQLTKDFQHAIAATMLSDAKLDSVDTSELARLNVKAEEQRLMRAFRAIGFADDEIEGRVAAHLERLASSAQKLTKWIADKKGETSIDLDDFVAVGLISRTRRILELATVLEEKKKEVFRLRDKFLEHCNTFFHDKRLSIGESGRLECYVVRARGDKPPKTEAIPLEVLSSGEKQLLILLMEALVQDNSLCVYITDEPELSLHVEWQEMLLKTVRDLNPNCQIIVATHSPDIVGPYRERKISMTEVIHV